VDKIEVYKTGKIEWIYAVLKKPKACVQVLVSFMPRCAQFDIDNFVVRALYVPPLYLKKDRCGKKDRFGNGTTNRDLFQLDRKTDTYFLREGWYEKLWSSDVFHELSLIGIRGEEIDYWAELPECNL